jgi:hypothetical protein|tara:strand:+ start:45 stop:353 length:309 start_codon:yes stop_codon:yes gene_type:complete
MTNRTKTEGSGRKKGTPNKLTHEIRGAVTQALEGELNKLPETLDALAPPQRIEAMLKLLKYVLPPIAPVTDSEIDKATLSPEAKEASLNSDIALAKLLNTIA